MLRTIFEHVAWPGADDALLDEAGTSAPALGLLLVVRGAHEISGDTGFRSLWRGSGGVG